MSKKQRPAEQQELERPADVVGGPMVRATRAGFYRNQRTKPGMTFRLLKIEDYEPGCMQLLDDEHGVVDMLAAAGSGTIKAPGAPPEKTPPERPSGKRSGRDRI